MAIDKKLIITLQQKRNKTHVHGNMHKMHVHG